MKDYLVLANQVENNPEKKNQLLDSFRTTNAEFRQFLFSLKDVNELIVPALIRTFGAQIEQLQIKTVKDVAQNSDVGTIFELTDGGSYKFTGFSLEGYPTFVKLGTKDHVELDITKEVKWLF